MTLETTESAWRSFKSLVSAKASPSRMTHIFESNASIRFIPSGLSTDARPLADVIATFVECADLRLSEQVVIFNF
jgi:hypothetical protein